jgi:protein arginine kinase activator
VKCDLCNNEATVHELIVSAGVPAERHLCEACAREQGLVTGAPAPVAELLQKIATASAVAATTGPAKAPACPECGTTFAEFKQSGRLGCPTCYEAFEQQLGPILDRAHQGATHHVGKVPRRLLQDTPDAGDVRAAAAAMAAAEARAEEIRRVRTDLDRAVKSEAYERAAQLRDRLRQLQRGSERSEESR